MALLRVAQVAYVIMFCVKIAWAKQDAKNIAADAAQLLVEVKAYTEEKRAVDDTTVEMLKKEVENLTQTLEDGKTEDQAQLNDAYKGAESACSTAESIAAITTSKKRVEDACNSLSACRNEATAMSAEADKDCKERDAYKSNPDLWPDLSRCTKAAITAQRIKLQASYQLVEDLAYCNRTYNNMSKTADEMDEKCEGISGQSDDKMQECDSLWDSLEKTTCEEDSSVVETCKKYGSECDTAIKKYDGVVSAVKDTSQHRVAADKTLMMMSCLVGKLGANPPPENFITSCANAESKGIDHWGLPSKDTSNLKKQCDATAIQSVMAQSACYGSSNLTIVDFCESPDVGTLSVR